jgi:hypothetical protein
MAAKTVLGAVTTMTNETITAALGCLSKKDQKAYLVELQKAVKARYNKLMTGKLL